MTHTTKPCTEKLSFRIDFFKFLSGINDDTNFFNVKRHKLQIENTAILLQSNTMIIIVFERNRNI